MRTVRTRGSSVVAVTITALSRIDSDAPRPLSRGIITAVAAPGLSIRSALPALLVAIYHVAGFPQPATGLPDPAVTLAELISLFLLFLQEINSGD
jgi:hypothetical protein